MALAGTLLGNRYQLDQPIGSGGYSQVWRAADSVLCRPVAVKLLHPGYAGHADALTRFQAEARHAGALSHPNIARVYDYGEPEGEQPFLVMELVEGPSLAHVLTGGALDAARTMDVIAQAACGLQAAHDEGLIHRDIKPGNLLLAPGGTVKITDFGIAHAAGSAPLTLTGMLLGTPGYLSPERASGAQATPATDVYALGIVAYECLAGAPPFAGPPLEVTLAHRDRPLPPLPADLPLEVVAFVMELAAKDPYWRPGSAFEVAQRAAHLRDDLILGPPLPPGPTAAAVPRTPTQAVIRPMPPESMPPGSLAVARDMISALAPAAVAAGMPVPPPVGRLRPRRRAALVSACIALVAFAGLGLASVAGFGPAARHPAVIPSARPSASASPSAARHGRATPSGQPVTDVKQQSGAAQQSGPQQSGTAQQPGPQQPGTAQQPGPQQSGPQPGPGKHGKGPKHGHQNDQGNDDAQAPGASG
ncbi:MAG: protein kinase domain-containing protein [Streptosporangiaceae bacterium]